MPLEFIEIADIFGETHKIAVDVGVQGDDTIKSQIWKASFSADGDLPTLVSPAAPMPVTGTTRWTDPVAAATVINGAGVSPTLKNLADSANKLGSVVDNTVSGSHYQYADFELLCRGASNMVSGSSIKLWILPCFDGTNYEDGGDSITPARFPDDQFYVRPISTAQRLVVRGILIPSLLFKVLLRNESGVAFTNTDAENVLRMRTYAEVAG